MNRSILIVICDFLLVSLLAFSTVDINKVSDEGRERTVHVEIATNQVESGKDLAAVMRVALEDERKHRDLLMGELSRSRQAATAQEQQLQNARQELQAREQEAQRWQQQFAQTKTNLEAMAQQLQTRSTEAALSQERLAALEAELRKKNDQASALQQQLSQLVVSNAAAATEKQRLAGQLAVVESERKNAEQQVSRMQEEVKVERAEKAKLAEGVQALATRSGQLEKEIHDNRPLAPNTLFNEFVSNRLDAVFTAHRSGLVATNKRRETQTVLVTDGTNTFAVCHVEETPLTLFNPGTDWEQLTCTFTRGAQQEPVSSLVFHFQDPRIMLLPAAADEAKRLGVKVYPLAKDPFKFQEAVLISASPTDSYYGECKFEMDLSTPQYVKLDRSFVRGLFGKFNPSRGDLVFTRTGEFLGIMANSTYCLVVRSYEASAQLEAGPGARGQKTGGLLALLYDRVTQLPAKVQ
jgi:hypothetical protein